MGNTIGAQGCFSYRREESCTFICEICMEPISQNQRFKSKRCSHPLCMDCISKYIEAKVQGNAAKVKCPHLQCNKFLDPLYCRSILSNKTFEKSSEVLCESTILRFQKVYCPNKNCSEFAVNECGEMVRKVKCPSCKHLFCFHCRVPWHSGYQCGETGIEIDENEVLLGKLVKKKGWQNCPYCNRVVARVSGCQIIRCRLEAQSINFMFYRCYGCNLARVKPESEWLT
ncbi:E3 ubiquitin-protein ligase RSL1-like [Tasmannia lanceolata]|uniref:E3 ubiquitin-protein ligase RSL1-like n=1 Tax=Tasmannia lanceolata TaxID=3420 RepID=UPI0040637592